MKPEENKLDPVNKKDAKGRFKNRDDKDIDNDGDVDNSDKYLHKRRKAIIKSVNESVSKYLSEGSLGDHMELIAYAKESGGVDKGDMLKAAGLMRKGNKEAFDNFVDGLDDYVADIIKSYL